MAARDIRSTYSRFHTSDNDSNLKHGSMSVLRRSYEVTGISPARAASTTLRAPRIDTHPSRHAAVAAAVPLPPPGDDARTARECS